MIILKNLPEKSGIYRFLSADQKILYIGKAINLKKRISSYFNPNQTHPKICQLVQQIDQVDIILTRTEAEALVLEAQQIRLHKPKYNFVFQDDKSYPYFGLSQNHSDTPQYSRLFLTRNRKISQQDYFGPITDLKMMRTVLALLQKKFKIRHCEDRFFNRRTRPCLQYQIQRCSAPCVGFVSPQAYQKNIDICRNILQGGPALSQWLETLDHQMLEAAQHQDYEQATIFRDQISVLQQFKQQITGILQISPDPTGLNLSDFDGIGLYESEAESEGLIGLYWIQVRANQLIFQQKTVVPVSDLLLESESESESESDLNLNLKLKLKLKLLDIFLGQSYVQPSTFLAPDIFLCTLNISNLNQTINANIIQKKFQKKLSILLSKPLQKIKWIITSDRTEPAYQKWHEFLSRGAYQAVLTETTQSTYYRTGFLELQSNFKLFNKPTKIECFDISHTSGLETIGGCVVFDANGFVYQDYRRFKIKSPDHIPGDDYAALNEAVTRRYLKSQSLPDILLIDGGKGQLSAVVAALQELQLDYLDVLILGLAKGPERRSGYEKIFRVVWPDSNELEFSDKINKIQYQAIELAPKNPGFLLLQRVRDEAHRFALSGHRKKRNQVALQSILESIPGIGPQKRKKLLEHFGGYQEIAQASVLELECVPGITKKLAQNIIQSIKLS